MASSDGTESWLLSFQFKIEKENTTKGRRHMNADLLGDLGLDLEQIQNVGLLGDLDLDLDLGLECLMCWLVIS